ncbi:hypothetical protein [Cryptosporangium aurantiacum]|uniref:Uncharacterized protein n=1 Tax=Cryptosporangium aurantiacum TaxID=134849 RepID=A0A1M7R268_9ACTN|nr:hypothetical protein [Cryptosporangium aurantiacum]SHN38803.1 hypothetical protein SAMN05443668_106141 [Cryptosporangium aurantiacum]
MTITPDEPATFRFDETWAHASDCGHQKLRTWLREEVARGLECPRDPDEFSDDDLIRLRATHLMWCDTDMCLSDGSWLDILAMEPVDVEDDDEDAAGFAPEVRSWRHQARALRARHTSARCPKACKPRDCDRDKRGRR